jgi:hypothetical protein
MSRRWTNTSKEKRIYKIPLAKMSTSWFPGRTDTKGIVSSIFIALAMIGIAQFVERLDTLLTGGLFPVVGRINSVTMIGVGSALYGLVGGLIVAELNPLIGTATGTTPIAPFFLITNAMQAVVACLVGAKFKNVISLKYTFLYSLAAALGFVVLYIPLHIFYFHLPWERLIPLYAFQSAVVIIVNPPLTRAVLEACSRAGFVEQ